MGNNPVLILTHNGIALTKRCVESVQKQDIPTDILFVDNDSNDGTVEWILSWTNRIHNFSQNLGVSFGWNAGLEWCFNPKFDNAEHVLVINNDTILTPFLYRELLAYDLSFITGRETITLSDLELPFEQAPLGGGPQFSCFLIRKEAWEKIGKFDESMWGWASDCDYHLRAHRLGMVLTSAPVLYYHERSSTINTAPPRERRQLEMQADADRMAFANKWGFEVGSPKYAAMFDEKFFGIDRKDKDNA